MCTGYRNLDKCDGTVISSIQSTWSKVHIQNTEDKEVSCSSSQILIYFILDKGC